jgi:hypothetical protein
VIFGSIYLLFLIVYHGKNKLATFVEDTAVMTPKTSSVPLRFPLHHMFL